MYSLQRLIGIFVDMLVRFLLVAVQLAHLVRQTTASKIRKALKDLPSVVEGLYDTYFTRIKNRHLETQKLFFKALSWIFHARRPLTISELIEALAVEEWQSARDVENYTVMILLLRLFSGLIVIQHPQDTVHFAHYSIQT